MQSGRPRTVFWALLLLLLVAEPGLAQGLQDRIEDIWGDGATFVVRVRNPLQVPVRIFDVRVFDCVQTGLGCGPGSGISNFVLDPRQESSIAHVVRAGCTNPVDANGRVTDDNCSRRPRTTFRYSYRYEPLQTSAPQTRPGVPAPANGGTGTAPSVQEQQRLESDVWREQAEARLQEQIRQEEADRRRAAQQRQTQSEAQRQLQVDELQRQQQLVLAQQRADEQARQERLREQQRREDERRVMEFERAKQQAMAEEARRRREIDNQIQGIIAANNSTQQAVADAGTAIIGIVQQSRAESAERDRQRQVQQEERERRRLESERQLEASREERRRQEAQRQREEQRVLADIESTRQEWSRPGQSEELALAPFGGEAALEQQRRNISGSWRCEREDGSGGKFVQHMFVAYRDGEIRFREELDGDSLLARTDGAAQISTRITDGSSCRVERTLRWNERSLVIDKAVGCGASSGLRDVARWKVGEETIDMESASTYGKALGSCRRITEEALRAEVAPAVAANTAFLRFVADTARVISPRISQCQISWTDPVSRAPGELLFWNDGRYQADLRVESAPASASSGSPARYVLKERVSRSLPLAFGTQAAAQQAKELADRAGRSCLLNWFLVP